MRFTLTFKLNRDWFTLNALTISCKPTSVMALQEIFKLCKTVAGFSSACRRDGQHSSVSSFPNHQFHDFNHNSDRLTNTLKKLSPVRLSCLKWQYWSDLNNSIAPMSPIRCSARHKFIRVLWFPFLTILDRGAGWLAVATASPIIFTSFVFFNTSAIYCAPMCVILGCDSNSMVPLVNGGHLFDKFTSLILEFFDIIVAICIAATSANRLLPSQSDNRFGCFDIAWDKNWSDGEKPVGMWWTRLPCLGNEHHRL